MNNCRKGKRGEQQMALNYKGYGFHARRGQQYQGTPDSPDIITSLPTTDEVKWRQQWSLYNWMAKLLAERRTGTLPVLWCKKNHCDWLGMVPADFLLELFQFVDWETYEEYRQLGDKS